MTDLDQVADLLQAALGNVQLAWHSAARLGGDDTRERLARAEQALLQLRDVLRTVWHGPNGHATSRARCGDESAVVVTDDWTLVTCEACKAARAAQEDDA